MRLNIAGVRIRMARRMQKSWITQDHLAARMQVEGIDLSKNTLSRIELGRRYITDVELTAFAKVLNVSTSWLLGETDNPTKQ